MTGVLAHCAEEIRPLLSPGSQPVMWVTERRSRVPGDGATVVFS